MLYGTLNGLEKAHISTQSPAPRYEMQRQQDATFGYLDGVEHVWVQVG